MAAMRRNFFGLGFVLLMMAAACLWSANFVPSFTPAGVELQADTLVVGRMVSSMTTHLLGQTSIILFIGAVASFLAAWIGGHSSPPSEAGPATPTS